MTEERVDVGIVGCGGLPQRVLLPCLSLIPRLQLVATCDLDAERARMVAERFGAKAWTTDWSELIDMDQLDAVMVAAPPVVHEEVGLAALEQGLHLFVEKPPSMSAGGARRLADAAQDTELVTMVGTVQRHVPAHRMMKDITEREEFGQPLLYQSRYFCPGPGMRMDWGMKREVESEMIHFFLLDHIIHHIDLARFFMGEVERVTATRTRGLEDQYAFVAGLEFDSGVSGSMSCGFRAPSFDNQVGIYGSGPAAVEVRNWTQLEYRPPQPLVGRGSYEDSPKCLWDGGITYQAGAIRPGYIEELTAWADAVVDHSTCHASVEDGWRDMLVLEALLSSLIDERTVDIPYAQ